MNTSNRFARRATLFVAAVFSVILGHSQTTPATGTTEPTPTESVAPEAKAETVKLETFAVTGIRVGIEAAVASKKESSSIVESISAEDIGKLPDISIAESIARLPGVAAQRVGGRAQVISVRGLSPDFATTLLNGREQVSTGDNRGIEFDQYPSELISSVTIYKTPDASLVGQGLSGTLDLRTIKPLSIGRRVIALNARYEVNSLDGLGSDSKHTGNRYSATYIDVNKSKTFGVALGYAHLESPILAQEFGTYGWNTNGRPGVPAGTQATDGLKMFARSGTNTRDGFIGVFEWRPNSNFSSTIDAYYSKFHHEETARGLEAHIGGYNGGNSPGLQYTATTITNNTLVGGTALGIYPLARNIYNNRTDKLTAVGWNAEYRYEKWIFTGDVSYSKAEREELNMETQAQYRDPSNQPVLDTATYNLATGDFPTALFNLKYDDPARVQIGPTIYGAGYGKVPMVEDQLTSYKLVASRGLGKYFSNLQFGINYADRKKDKEQPEASLDVSTWNPVAPAALLSATNLGFSSTPSTLSWSVPVALTTNYAPFNPSSTAFGYLIQKTWRVDEQIAVYFAQFNLDHQLGGVHLRGNIGLQGISVDQSSTSNYFDNAAPPGQQVKVNHDGKTYTDVLPSANLIFDFGNQILLRVAAAKQVARPRLDQLKSAFEFSIDSSTHLPSGNGGNPLLDPWKATAYDISLEKYFAKNKGYISIAGFYKDLDTYIYDQTDPNYDFSRFTVDSPVPVTTPFGSFTQPLNGRGGSLKGLELSLSLPFSLLTETLDGFGLVASYTRNSSEITIDNTNLGSAIMLPGLSETVTNLTLYYEKHGFSARVSQRYRSDFVGEITGFGADRELRYVRGESVVDAQIGYTFQGGAFKGLGFFLQAYNLNNSKYETYQQSKDRLVEYQKYGRTYLTGVNYSF